jgi:division protein CdvB (Snf7/Vps24/ESCRT-III family)
MTNQATDKSLDKSQSYPAMMDPEQAEKLNELSGEDEEAF